ncbi:MAG: fasciclin domain-containing protein, partial [Candidatus Fonsibacter sp.]
MKDGQKLKTVQGNELDVEICGGKVKVGGAAVTADDMACSDGIIQVIGTVLLPPVKYSPIGQVGATAQLGFFDLAGLTVEGDESGIRDLCASEIRHGRVVMMAVSGGVARAVAFSTASGVPTNLGAVTTRPGIYGFVALCLISGVRQHT